MNKKVSTRRSPFILWKDLLDLGLPLYLARIKRHMPEKEALKELKKSFSRQSEEHWQGLCSAFKKLK